MTTRMATIGLACLLVTLVLAGCSSPTTDGAQTTTSAYGVPGDQVGLPERLLGLEFVTNANPNGTTGFWIEEARDLAYLSGGAGLRIVDIRDPAQPSLLSSGAEGTTGTRDVEVFTHPDGRTYAVMVNGGSAAVLLVDVTDPTAPSVVSSVDLPASHTIAVVPNSTVVYNSRSISTHVPGAGETGQIDILDFADPAKPTVKVFVFPAVAMTVGGVPRPVLSTTCHEMTFNAERQRAYCGGVTDSMVWDVKDPANPAIQQVIDWPGTNIHHGIWDARGGDLLILGDEFAGVLTPSPPCTTQADLPTSALWFFDISDLANPTPVGYFQIQWDQLDGSDGAGVPPYDYCSTHLGDVIQERDHLVLGWYAGGTVLVDFTDPANARQVDAYHAPPPTSVWEARYHDGHVYAADTQRGLDVLKLV